MTIQVDTYLDPATGDLPAITRLVTGIDLIEQRIRRRLRRGLGEWFLDPAGTGLPLLPWREMKPPDVPAIVARLQIEIRAVPGVTATRNFTGVHDPAARRLTISGDVLAADQQVSAVVLTALLEASRNAFLFAVFFSRGSGSIVRPAFRGP